MAAWSPNGRLIASVGFHDKRLFVRGLKDSVSADENNKEESDDVVSRWKNVSSSSPSSPSPLLSESIYETGHRNYISAVCWSPDSVYVATASSDVRIFVAATGTLVATLTESDNVSSVAWSSNGRWLALGPGDNTVQIWNILIPNLNHNPTMVESDDSTGNMRANTSFNDQPKTLIFEENSTVSLSVGTIVSAQYGADDVFVDVTALVTRY
jgi:WD40 repeat protein